MSNEIIPGSILRRTIPGPSPLQYLAYVPMKPQRHKRVMVTVHGISRNAEQHISGFAPQAESYGVVMLAPLFPEQDFPCYQRLGRSATEGRADEAFEHMLQDAAEWLDIQPAPLHVFGFSGGGQFIHRYALFNPRRVARMALAAPGWYTFPDPSQHYPLGLRSSSGWPRLNFSMPRFFKISTLVLVGEEDDLRTEGLNRSRRIDAAQGLTRMERAERWVGAMKALARAFHVPSRMQLESVPNANHAFTSYLAHPPFAENVFQFLFSEQEESIGA